MTIININNLPSNNDNNKENAVIEFDGVNVCFNRLVTNKDGVEGESGKWCLLMGKRTVLAGYFFSTGMNEFPFVQTFQKDLRGNEFPRLDFVWVKEVLAKVVKVAISIRQKEGEWTPGDESDGQGNWEVSNNYRRYPIPLGKTMQIKTWVPAKTEKSSKLMSPEDVAKLLNNWEL